MTGIDGVPRHTNMYALNLRGVAMHHAKHVLGKSTRTAALSYATSTAAFPYRRTGTDASSTATMPPGETAPIRRHASARSPVADILEYVRDKDIGGVKKLCTRTGGFVSHFGTSSSDAVHKMAEEGEQKAIRVWDGMKYQIVKYIGAMAAVLGGRVDGILLTGGLLRFEDITQTIREQCEWIAPVSTYPGEVEHEALAAGGRCASCAARKRALHRPPRLGRLAR